MKSRGQETGEGYCNEFLTLCDAVCDAMLGGDTQTSKQALDKQKEDKAVKLISRRRMRRKERQRTEDRKNQEGILQPNHPWGRH